MDNYFLIIDGSSLLCTQFYGNDLLQAPTGEYTNGVYGFMRVLSKIVKNFKPSHLAVCWDVSRNTFRKEAFSDYKANRDETPDPLKQQFILCQKILKNIGVKQFFSENFEADDYAGTLSKMFENDINIKIMTKDKDYFQCLSEKTHIWKICNKKKDWENLITKYSLDKKTMPDKLFELTPEILELEYGYSKEKVVLIKALMGDSSDNIPGIEGIGEKSALVLAQNYSSLEEIYSEIEGMDEAALDSWRKTLKLRKPVTAALLKEETKYEGKTNKDLGLLSQELATIKRDIPLDITLDDLVLNIDSKKAEEELLKLAIKTIKF